MKIKRIALILLAVLLVSAAACTKKGGNETASTTASPASTKAPADGTGTGSGTDSGTEADTGMPETPYYEEVTADYDGYGFVFYCRGCCEHAASIFPASDSADIVDAAAYRRNERVYEVLNAEICEPTVGTDGYPDDLVAQLQAGDNVCDAILWHRLFLGKIALEGYLSNLNQYSGFHFDRDYWATDIVENYSLNGITFLADGYYTTDIQSDTGCLVFNERIYDDMFHGEPTLYEKVNKGEWTLDTFAHYVKEGAADLDGDGMFIPGDVFGMIISRQHLFQFQGCADQLSVDRDDNGKLQYVLFTDRMVSIVEKVYDFTLGLPSTYMIESAEQARNMFAEGNCLFTTTALRDLTWETMRNMRDGYGVLPYPKYDEYQKEYKARLFAHSSLLGLPYNVTDGERSSVILDVMAEVGYREVAPVFYEQALKNKYTSEESWEMLDLIMKGVTSDFGDVIDTCPVYYLDHVVGVTKSRDFASAYDAGKDGVLADLESTVQRYEKYADQ